MMITMLSLLFMSILVQFASSEAECKCSPDSPCWPNQADFHSLNVSLSGALIQGRSPASICYKDQPNHNESLCAIAREQWTNSTWHAADPVSIDYTLWANNSCNPIYPNGTDVNGNPDAGKQGCTIGGYPAYVVNATSAEQVGVALKWAGQKNIRVIVKNTGHNFLGRSAGYGSLSIWTHNLRGIEYIPDFAPISCSANSTLKAMRVGAGEVGIDVTKEAAKQGLVVVTGGNTDVGLAGWMTGGGHGYLSSLYGMGSDNLLEATIVTPSGETVLANPCQNTDLFYASRGGGGGTFGVLISAVIAAHPTPQTTSHNFNITLQDAKNEKEFWDLMGFIHSEMPRLKDAGLAGYYFIYGPPETETFLFSWSMYIYDQPNGTIEELMQPIIARLDSQSSLFTYAQQESWYATYLDAYSLKQAEAVGTPAATMGSRLLSPESLANATRVAKVLRSIGPSADAEHPLLFSGSLTASAHPPIYHPTLSSLLPAWRRTTIHLALITTWPATLSHSLTTSIFNSITNKTQALRDLAPDTGAYLNECDYFEPRWQGALFGGEEEYGRLREVKGRWDPGSVLWCQRCVGSEGWELEEGEGRRLCRL